MHKKNRFQIYQKNEETNSQFDICSLMKSRYKQINNIYKQNTFFFLHKCDAVCVV